MDSPDLLTLETLCAWLDGGRQATFVTIAATWGAAPRPAGAWAAIRDDGIIIGSVSGGCVEEDLIARVRAGEFVASGVHVLRYGVTAEETSRFNLPCGGTLELVLESRPDVSGLRLLHERITQRRATTRTVEVASGAVLLEDATRGDPLVWDGKRLSTVHGSRQRLLLIGAVQISSHLATMAQALDYEVFVCDPREEYRAGWRDIPGVLLLGGMPDDVVRQFLPDPWLAVVALTHDAKLDDLVLLEALRSSVLYVGVLGSRQSNQRRRKRLAKHFGVDATTLARLRGPVGLPIGSHTPPEIAVSILAEMIAVRNGVVLPVQGMDPSLPSITLCAT
ncbi:xanthine dehydrogenase accessory factor [Gammaproteobacteria bacterium]